MSTLIVLCPQTALAPFALGYVEATITLFEKVKSVAPQRSLTDNLSWLIRVHERASHRIPMANDSLADNEAGDKEDALSPEDADHLSLVGWRTRLVEEGANHRPNVRAFPAIPKPADKPIATTLTDQYNTISLSEAQAFNLADETHNGDASGWPLGNDVFMNWLDACEPDVVSRKAALCL